MSTRENIRLIARAPSLGTCVQDIKSCPTHAVESRKIHNGFGTLVPGLKHVSRACPTVFDRVQVLQQAPPWKTSDVMLIFVFLDDASTVRSCNVILEHHVLAI